MIYVQNACFLISMACGMLIAMATGYALRMDDAKPIPGTVIAFILIFTPTIARMFWGVGP